MWDYHVFMVPMVPCGPLTRGFADVVLVQALTSRTNPNNPRKAPHACSSRPGVAGTSVPPGDPGPASGAAGHGRPGPALPARGGDRRRQPPVCGLLGQAV